MSEQEEKIRNLQIDQLEKMIDTHNLLPNGSMEKKEDIELIPTSKEWAFFYAGFIFADKIIHQEPKWGGDLIRIKEGFENYRRGGDGR